MVSVRVSNDRADVVPATAQEAMEIAAAMPAIDPTAIFMQSGAARCRLSALTALAPVFPPDMHSWDTESARLARTEAHRSAAQRELRSKVAAALDAPARLV